MCATEKRWDLIRRRTELELRSDKKNIKPEDLLTISVSPHIQGRDTATLIMLWVIVALLPLTAYAIYVCGWSAVTVIASSIVGSVSAEFLIQRFRHVPVSIGDLSAVLTGLLLALTLPPRLPFWMPLIGGVVAIALGKQVFGGLGHNIFNPALVGRAILAISWPKYMNTSYLVHPKAWAVNTAQIKTINAVTSATPLFAAKQVRSGALQINEGTYVKPLLLGNPWGAIGEVSALLVIVGLLILLLRGIVDWRIPVCFVGTVVILSSIRGQNPLFAAFSGGLMLGACFMATDYVTNPMTSWGKVIFATGCGVVTYLLRFHSNLPEGVMFSILFMNGLTPLIDRYIKPRPFGHSKRSIVPAKEASEQ
ncbi:MAG: RnfABCDGE type electron transport complex subunit D [Actinomycetota bacterium]|nr:RnfABCDGE type electron transport complex subunit D [Actinomycetota bacterium]